MNDDHLADRADERVDVQPVVNVRRHDTASAAETSLEVLLAVDIDLANVLEGFYHPRASVGGPR